MSSELQILSDSENGYTVAYGDGRFAISRYGDIVDPISIGNSLENNQGGQGAFAGEVGEFFCYIGYKYPEIAFATIDKDTGKWKNHAAVEFRDKNLKVKFISTSGYTILLLLHLEDYSFMKRIEIDTRDLYISLQVLHLKVRLQMCS